MGLHRETGNQSQVGLMMRNNLPPNGKTTTNFHPSYSKKNLNPGHVVEQGANFIDPRPGSAIVLNNSRPFVSFFLFIIVFRLVQAKIEKAIEIYENDKSYKE